MNFNGFKGHKTTSGTVGGANKTVGCAKTLVGGADELVGGASLLQSQ